MANPIFSPIKFITNNDLVSMCTVGHIFTGLGELNECIVCIELWKRKEEKRKNKELKQKNLEQQIEYKKQKQQEIRAQLSELRMEAHELRDELQALQPICVIQ